jgi:hypothetical protein
LTSASKKNRNYHVGATDQSYVQKRNKNSIVQNYQILELFFKVKILELRTIKVSELKSKAMHFFSAAVPQALKST